MCNLNKLPALILSLSLLALPLSSHADSNIRIHGGITIETGGLRLTISDRYLSGHIYTNHYYGHSRHHRSKHHRSEGYHSGAYVRSYPIRIYSDRYHRHYVQPGHRYHSEHRAPQRRVIKRHYRQHEGRRFHHQRSYGHW